MPRAYLVLALFQVVVLALAACVPLRGPTPAREAVSVRPTVPRRLPKEATPAAYQRMLKEARAWREKAAAVGGEWRDVGPLLEQAADAAQCGDFARAIELAEYARFQAEMGYLQRQAQEEVAVPPYLRR